MRSVGDETSKEVQVIGKDNIKNILIIVTWNFEENVESGMYQCKCDGKQAEKYIVKGLNGNKNYFMKSNHIIDLEYNIPF